MTSCQKKIYFNDINNITKKDILTFLMTPTKHFIVKKVV